MKAHTKRLLRKIIAPIRRIGLRNRKFSIISNNCWGGYIYDIYGLQYQTPTIGIYFFAEEYIKFINNLKYYLSIDCKPLDINESKYKDELLKRNNMYIGHVGDVEIVFAHYENAYDGCKKWNKRRKRVIYNNLLLKFNDQNLFTMNMFKEFENIDYKHKVFFTSIKELNGNPDVYYIKKYEKEGYVLDDIKSSKKICNYKKLLNGMIKDES